MAIKQGDIPIIDNTGKLQNSPALTVSHPSASETVVSVQTFGSSTLGKTDGFVADWGGSYPTNPIGKFPFASGTVTAMPGPFGNTYQRSSCGNSDTAIYLSPPSNNAINKCPVATGTSTVTYNTGPGSDTSSGNSNPGGGGQSDTHYYETGYGNNPNPGPASGTNINKVPFANDTQIFFTGSLSAIQGAFHANCCSDTAIYTQCGTPPGDATVLDKFPFALPSGTAIDVGTLGPAPPGRWGGAGISSSSHGHHIGGANSPSVIKYPFALTSGITAITHCTPSNPNGLYVTGYQGFGCQSVTHGYSGGNPFSVVPPGFTNQQYGIVSFPFAITDSMSISWPGSGNTIPLYGSAGAQV